MKQQSAGERTRLSRDMREMECSTKDLVEHCRCQAPRLRVLLAGMIGGDDDDACPGRSGHQIVTEGRSRSRLGISRDLERFPDAGEGNPSQGHDHAQVSQVRDFSGEKWQASADLFRRRTVVRRRTSTDGGDESVLESQAVTEVS
jgi:hypothetical protein